MMKAAKEKKTSKRPPIAERALIAARQANAHMRGEHVPGLVVRRPVDVRALREKTGLSQNEFAEAFGFSLSAVRDWEQGRKMPERATSTLLRAISMDPDLIKKAAKAGIDSEAA